LQAGDLAEDSELTSEGNQRSPGRDALSGVRSGAGAACVPHLWYAGVGSQLRDPFVSPPSLPAVPGAGEGGPRRPSAIDSRLLLSRHVGFIEGTRRAPAAEAACSCRCSSPAAPGPPGPGRVPGEQRGGLKTAARCRGGRSYQGLVCQGTRSPGRAYFTLEHIAGLKQARFRKPSKTGLSGISLESNQFLFPPDFYLE